jgi:hypothetical protein
MKKRRPPAPPSSLPVGTKEGRLSAHANPALQRRSVRSVERLMTAAEAVLGREGWAAFTINAVAAEGERRYAISGTPTLILNGNKINNAAPAELSKLIDAELAKAK